MADDRTPDTGNIATQETHARLLQLIVALLRLAECFVYVRHRRLKRRELHHRVRDLPPPQRRNPLIQPRIPLLRYHLAPALAQTAREGRQCGLHAHFDGFEGAQRHVGEELGRGAGGEVDDGFVGVGEQPLAVIVFEGFVEAVFAAALEAVADEGGAGAEEDAFEAVGAGDGAPGGEVGAVDFGVDLAPAFDLGERLVRG